MQIATILIMAMLAGTNSALAGEIYIQMLGNAADQSAISGTCTYPKKDDSTIRCETVQISVSYKLDQSAFDKESKTGAASLGDDFKSDDDVKKFCNEVHFDSDEAIRRLKNPTDKQKESFALMGPVALKRGADIIEVCKHPTIDGLWQVAHGISLSQTKQCQIKTGSPSVYILKKVSDTKWISTDGPSGLCHTVATDALERTDKTSPLWTWTSVTSTADDSTLCKDFGVTQSVNKPLVFTWRNGPFPMHCETIGFGDTD